MRWEAGSVSPFDSGETGSLITWLRAWNMTASTPGRRFELRFQDDGCRCAGAGAGAATVLLLLLLRLSPMTPIAPCPALPCLAPLTLFYFIIIFFTRAFFFSAAPPLPASVSVSQSPPLPLACCSATALGNHRLASHRLASPRLDFPRMLHRRNRDRHWQSQLPSAHHAIAIPLLTSTTTHHHDIPFDTLALVSSIPRISPYFDVRKQKQKRNHRRSCFHTYTHAHFDRFFTDKAKASPQPVEMPNHPRRT